MEYKDYYQTLGVDRKADKPTIKKAYRKLARQYHPDVSKETNAEAKFKDVSEAYNVLKDDQKRASYDQLGSNWHAGQDFHTPPGWQQHTGNASGRAGADQQNPEYTYSSSSTQADSASFSDFFDSLFGHAGNVRGTTDQGNDNLWRQVHNNAKGQDQHASIQIDLADTYHGTTRQLSLTEPGFAPDGQVISKQRSLKVKIPKGMVQGQTIRLKGQGAHAPGGKSRGDLYLEINLTPHRLFKVNGKDINLLLPVAPWEAALGAQVVVPLPDGKTATLKIPADSNSGKQFRLKSKGIPATVPGNLIVSLSIVTPPSTNDKTKAAYEALQKSTQFNARAKLL